jgi:DNA ligase-1
MFFAELAQASERIAATAKRTEKLALLAEQIARMPEPELAAGVHFLAGELAQGKIGIGYAALRALFELPPAPEPTLAIAEVDRAFTEAAALRGAGAARRRIDTIRALLARATRSEQQLIRKLLVGEIRQGALESLVVDAIAKAHALTPQRVRRAQMIVADLGKVALTARRQGEPGLAAFTLSLFVPVQPMLAQPAESVADALAQHERAAFEWKLDGARVQIHKSGSEVRAYSRRLNEVTARVPELVEAVTALPARELILDGEVIALREDGAPHPFQVTMRRFGRRAGVAVLRAELPLRTFAFDCLRVDDQLLLDAPFSERIRALGELLPESLAIPRVITADRAEAEAFLAQAFERGHEGVMAKSLAAPYEAGNRGASWLKLKQAHTLDLVVLAAEWGSGRREGWLSNLHLGARDEASGQLVMLGKTFKGMTDEMLAWQTKRLLELETHRDRHVVFVRPELVVEIAFSDVQASSQYPGGLALRFARVKRYREDKRAEDADTIAHVRAFHVPIETREP